MAYIRKSQSTHTWGNGAVKMLVKIQLENGETVQYNSQENLIAVLFTPSDKNVVENMAKDDLLFLSGPFRIMSRGVEKAWAWAYDSWIGAHYVKGPQLDSQSQPPKGY